MSKAYIGYDLGDGETITDITILDDQQTRTAVQTLFIPMEMPDNNTAGQAIPTAFAIDVNGNIVFASSILDDPTVYQQICVNFKRRPSDMVRKTNANRTNEIINAFDNGWPSSREVPEADFAELEKFSDIVVTFTNAVFNDPKYLTKVHDTIISCDSVMFCVGHPTRWDKLDIAIYKAILAKSILGAGVYAGKPSEFIMDAESRAAFLYVKDKTGAAILPQGKAALLIDVGSSTIDVTATTADSRNHLYNSGNNYLGVRCIDFIIRDWYLQKLKEDPEDWEVYKELVRRNPSMRMALALSCRKAKEEVFSLAAKKAKIGFADFAPVRITQNDVNTLVEEYPIADVLKDTIGIPEDVAKALSGKTWIQLFREFVTDQKTALEAQNISVGRIILTGSASKMPFVKEIVSEVYENLGEDGVLSDLNPSRSISMGLALIGPNDEKARRFEEEVEAYITDSVPDCISKNIPALADSLSEIADAEITALVKKHMTLWKEGGYTTLNDMTQGITSDCSKENLNRLLQNNPRYQEAINSWTVDKVGADIAVGLKGICDNYGVSGITLGQLNVFKVPDISIGNSVSVPTDVLTDAIAAVIAVIAGIVLYAILPVILVVVLELISVISVEICLLLCDLLLLIPGPGWVLLAGIAGVALFKALKNGGGEAKRRVGELVKKANLPGWARKLISDEKINAKLKDAKIKETIKQAIVKDDAKEQVISSISSSLRSQIEERIESIKYLIK